MSSWQRDLTRNQKVDVALKNEELTRRRVEALERYRLEDLKQMESLLSRHVGMGLIDRLRWLVKGEK